MDYFLKAKKFQAKKRLGQNFLVDQNILETIVDSVDPKTDETIIEIGPGLGFLTELIAQKAKEVIAIEIDKAAIKEIHKLNYTNIRVIEKDILKTQLSELVDKPVKIVANLPYYITTPILVHLIGDVDETEKENRKLISEMTIMVQKEVGDRLVATEKSANKAWSSLSILTNYWSIPEIVTDVKNTSFYPKPKVHSSVLRLEVREKPAVNVQTPLYLRRVVRSAFQYRRKKLVNALENSGFKKEIILESLDKASLDLNTRGEKLSLEDFAKLSDELYQKKNL